ncbi:neuronal acetylcholine receptor subunit alpha-10-like isoform X1 [Mytilus californianus]|uniref:neuronal acetylcholine receptor subunit alpha-10-like isoform X1 n=2 Tax=Mytilus californianus TaxID=6549 RepID=UPI0022460B04|nr:neuronal acetylcholine receptor subunit alpha-10-like isoform X1 [Mytilus californianus]
MDLKINFLLIIVWHAFLVDVECLSTTKQIYDAIFTGYDNGLRPVCGGATLVNLSIGVAVRQLIDLDEPNQVMKINLWIRLKWTDCLLQWNSSEYNNTGYIVVPISKIWTPDLTLYDSLDSEMNGMDKNRASIYSDGSVYYNFPTLIEVICPIDVTSFPFDTQVCALLFGSWVYHGNQLDMQARDNPSDLSSMKTNVEWVIQKIVVERHEVVYGCCPDPYPDVTFYIHVERKPAYYITNIIIPSIMITSLGILCYFLPVDSGEKASLIITVMLAMSVFQLLVADKLPPSADSTPWIMFFFNFILGLSAVSTTVQVFVINIYYRGEKEMPQWIKRGILVPLCFMTFVNIPGNRPSICGKEKKVGDLIKDVEQSTNTELWQFLSVAIDRLGLVLFTITLIAGSSYVWSAK